MSDAVESLEDIKTLGTGSAAPVAAAAPVEPKIDDLGRSYGTGRRKSAIARVWLSTAIRTRRAAVS